MSAIKRQYHDVLTSSSPFPPSLPSLPSAFPLSPEHVFILTMNGKPLSVYYSPATAERDLTLMRAGDERDGYSNRYSNTYSIKEMRVDSTIQA